MEDVATRVDSGPVPGGPHAETTEPTARAEAATPARIGHYTVLRLLGEGGMGVVYSAYDAELDRKVAIKLLHPRPRGAADGAAGTKRLLREAQAMAKISHPNVLPVFEAGTHDERVYVVLEHVEGSTLRAWWQQAPRTWQALVAMFVQVGEGLAAAHAAGIIHRDLKPDNVLVDAHGRARVLDFGLARVAGEHAHAVDEGQAVGSHSSLDVALTVPGSVMGTPAYMPPEQLGGRPVDARCDQFAFCVSLWEALWGKRPFAGANVRGLALAIQAGRLAETDEKRAPTWLRQVLARGLAAEPGDRYASMHALLAALRADPRARLRRVVMIAAAVVFACAGVFGYVLAAAADAEACEGGAERFAEITGQAAGIEAAFASTGRAHAGPTAVAVAGELRRYGEAWVAMYRDACMTSLRGEQSDELLDRRMACLERRRGEARALVEVFAGADGEAVDRAVAAVQGLPAVAGCDVTAAAAAVALPEDPAAREQIEQLEREVDALAVAMGAGRVPGALAATEPLVARAEALGYGPLIADVTLLRGRLLHRLGKASEAETWLFKALWLAEGQRHDEAVAEAWIELVSLAGELQGHFAASQRWADGGDAALRRIGDPPLLRARWLNNRGISALAAMRLTEALALFEQTERIYREQLGPDSVDVASALNNVANTLSKMQRKDEARAMHARVLALRERLLGPMHPDVAASCVNLGGLLADRTAGLRMYARADEILRASFGEEDPRRANVLVNTGILYIRNDDRGPAKPLFEQALAILVKTASPDNPTLAYVRISLGMLRALDGEFAAAEAVLHAELARIEDGRGTVDGGAAELRMNLATMHAHRGDVAGSEALLRRNMAALTGNPQGISAATVGTRAALGQVLVRTGRLEEAAELLRELVGLCAQMPDAGETACVDLGYHEAELALARRDMPGALRAIRRFEAMPRAPGAEMDPIDVAEKEVVRGQILVESGADRVAGRRAVEAGLATLRGFREYDPAFVAAVQGWLARQR